MGNRWRLFWPPRAGPDPKMHALWAVAPPPILSSLALPGLATRGHGPGRARLCGHCPGRRAEAGRAASVADWACRRRAARWRQRIHTLNDVGDGDHRGDHDLRRRAAGLWVLWRYSAKRNPTPGTVSHNSVLEAAWTAHSGADPGGHLHPQPAPGLLRRPHARRRHDGEGDRPSMVLGIHLPRCRRHCISTAT